MLELSARRFRGHIAVLGAALLMGAGSPGPVRAAFSAPDLGRLATRMNQCGLAMRQVEQVVARLNSAESAEARRAESALLVRQLPLLREAEAAVFRLLDQSPGGAEDLPADFGDRWSELVARRDRLNRMLASLASRGVQLDPEAPEAPGEETGPLSERALQHLGVLLHSLQATGVRAAGFAGQLASCEDPVQGVQLTGLLRELIGSLSSWEEGVLEALAANHAEEADLPADLARLWQLARTRRTGLEQMLEMHGVDQAPDPEPGPGPAPIPTNPEPEGPEYPEGAPGVGPGVGTPVIVAGGVAPEGAVVAGGVLGGAVVAGETVAGGVSSSQVREAEEGPEGSAEKAAGGPEEKPTSRRVIAPLGSRLLYPVGERHRVRRRVEDLVRAYEMGDLGSFRSQFSSGFVQDLGIFLNAIREETRDQHGIRVDLNFGQVISGPSGVSARVQWTRTASDARGGSDGTTGRATFTFDRSQDLRILRIDGQLPFGVRDRDVVDQAGGQRALDMRSRRPVVLGDEPPGATSGEEHAAPSQRPVLAPLPGGRIVSEAERWGTP